MTKGAAILWFFISTLQLDLQWLLLFLICKYSAAVLAVAPPVPFAFGCTCHNDLCTSFHTQSQSLRLQAAHALPDPGAASNFLQCCMSSTEPPGHT